MHHHNIRLRTLKPRRKQILRRNVRRQEPAMALVFAVVGEAAALAREGADEVGVGYACVLELLPEESAPAAL